MASINYLIFTISKEQVLVKKTTQDDFYIIEFRSFAGGNEEYDHCMRFKEKSLRDSLFDNLLVPQTDHTKKFITDIYNEHLLPNKVEI